ncbi:uncharacterized protein LOC102802637 [Saccoglossus kowalevskii]|uniref:Uncharacterized protein LOC102802637 n=1 Tax=Saccoglossus kowalevskii TaxID=10224 RepID=A0ABM0MPG1_SACKO|nr:PREDICTED: uncharacterized protein LOC102802637 [Saccoglossus kowalevskii]
MAEPPGCDPGVTHSHYVDTEIVAADDDQTLLPSEDIGEEDYNVDKQSDDVDDKKATCTFTTAHTNPLLLIHFKCRVPCVCTYQENWAHMSGWKPNFTCDDSSKYKRNKKRPKFPYRLAYSTYREPKYVFRHYEDTSKYMEQYRYHHTRGDVCKAQEEPLVLGYNVPDPYKPKLHRYRFLFETLDTVLSTKPLKNSGLGESDESDSQESNLSISVTRKPVTVNLAPTRNQSTARKTDDLVLPKIEQGIPQFFLDSRKKDSMRSDTNVILPDVRQCHYTSFTLPGHLVDDYRELTGKKRRSLPPVLNGELYPVGYQGISIETRSAGSEGSSANSVAGEVTKDTIVVPPKPIPYRLWQTSPGRSMQEYLAHIYSVRSAGSLEMGTNAEDPEREGQRRRREQKPEMPVRIGLCTFYSSNTNDSNEVAKANTRKDILGVQGKSTGGNRKDDKTRAEAAKRISHIKKFIKNEMKALAKSKSLVRRRAATPLAMDTVVTGNQYRTEEGHKEFLANQKQPIENTSHT